jgi:hypothetical protein
LWDGALEVRGAGICGPTTLAVPPVNSRHDFSILARWIESAKRIGAP